MRSKVVQELLQAWKQEANESHLMLSRLRNGVLTIYTDRPGPMIGRAGALVNKYKQQLEATHYVKEVYIVDTDDIF